MKTVSIKLTDDLAERTEALKARTGFSESAIIRQAILAGLVRVEEGINLIHSEHSDPQAA